MQNTPKGSTISGIIFYIYTMAKVTMTSSNRLLVISIVVAVSSILILILSNFLGEKDEFMKVQPDFVGNFIDTPDEKLSTSINEFLEEKENMTCSHNYLGRDDKFAYIQAFCERYSYNQQTGALDNEAGWSAPVVLQLKDDKVLAYELPRDGALYEPDIQRLFPGQLIKEMDGINSNNDLGERNKFKFLTNYDQDIETKIDAVAEKYSDFEDFFDSGSFAGKDFSFKKDNGNYYLVYIIHGSGVWVAKLDCFKVADNNEVATIEVKGDLTSYSDQNYIDPISCSQKEL